MMTTVEQWRAALQELRQEIAVLAAQQPTTSGPGFTSWHSRAISILSRALSPTHHITAGFSSLTWSSIHSNYDQQVFMESAGRAGGYLEAAIAELALPGESDDGATWVDPELWAHVSAHFGAEDWPTVASQAAIFTEDRIRRWSGQPPEVVGHNLMVGALGERGATGSA